MTDGVPDVLAAGIAPPTVTWLLCSHNRREATLHALSRIHKQEGVLATTSVVLVDDNSTDHTPEAVRSCYPDVRVHPGSGSLYWSGAMAVAQRVATSDRAPDFLCWVNDDVDLDARALGSLLAVSRQFDDRAIVVGGLVDPVTSAVTYAGFRRVGRRPKQLAVVSPTGRPEQIDAFHGNLVLIPRVVYEIVGAVDPRFRHRFGDTDYGYRARRSGFENVLAPYPLGSCARNSVDGTWEDSKLPVRMRLRQLFSVKGMPVRPTLTFDHRYAGARGLAYSAGSYARAISTIVVTSCFHRFGRADALDRVDGGGHPHATS